MAGLLDNERRRRSANAAQRSQFERRRLVRRWDRQGHRPRAPFHRRGHIKCLEGSFTSPERHHHCYRWVNLSCVKDCIWCGRNVACKNPPQ